MCTKVDSQMRDHHGAHTVHHYFFFFQAEDGIRDVAVTGVQTCALPICTTMKAIILAAGQGTRLLPLTEHRPKCMVEIAGKPLLYWQLEVLRNCGVTNIGLVTGYKAQSIDALGVHVFRNADYMSTNMVASL